MLFRNLQSIKYGFCIHLKNHTNKKTLSKAWRFFYLYDLLVIAIGFEPMTVCLEGRCSIQLSYAT